MKKWRICKRLECATSHEIKFPPTARTIVFVIRETPCRNWFGSFVVVDINLTYDFLDFYLLDSTGRPKRQPFITQTSSVTEAPSDEVEAEQEGDEDVEPARVTQSVDPARLQFVNIHNFSVSFPSFSSQINRSPSERHSSDKENQIFRGETKVPAGQKALRCAWRDRAVFTRPPQHDGSNKGAYQRLSQLVISCLQSRVIN